MDKARAWIHPKFKKKLQQEAIDNDMSLLEYTERLSDNAKSLENKLLKKGGRKIEFNF